MVVRKRPTVYIWVTWIVKLLAGEATCTWAVWFRAHFSYSKRLPAGDFTRWRQEHDEMVDYWAEQLRVDGYQVRVEDENLFRFGRDGIVLAGKPDIVALNAVQALVVDCKSGSHRAWHHVQVQVYMVALPWTSSRYRSIPIMGRTQYADGSVEIACDEITDEFRRRLRDTIRAVARDAPLPTAPGLTECSRCDISGDDCPDRLDVEMNIVKMEHNLF